MSLKVSLTTSSVNNISLEEYKQHPEIIHDIQPETVQSLNKYLDFFEVGPKSYFITARSFIGVIKLNDYVILNITPKMDINNILSMLNYTYDIPLILSDDVLLEHSEQLLKFLITLFIQKVKNLIFNNFRRSYRTIQENRKTVKGKVLISQNIKDNRFRNNKIFCEYDDFTSDILINRIIKFTIYLLFQIDDGNFTYQLRHLYSLLKNVSLVNISIADIDSIKYTRLTEAYRPIHDLCRLFIENIFISHKIGDHRIFSFLINMNDLFEKFVRNVLDKFSMYTIQGHPRQKYLDETQLAKIIPDIRVVQKGKVSLVMDCKYKKLTKIKDDDEKAKVINSDVYQILSYVIGYGVDTGVLIYPKHEVQSENKLVISLQANKKNIIIKPINLNEINDCYLKEYTKELDSIMLREPG